LSEVWLLNFLRFLPNVCSKPILIRWFWPDSEMTWWPGWWPFGDFTVCYGSHWPLIDDTHDDFCIRNGYFWFSIATLHDQRVNPIFFFCGLRLRLGLASWL
jgi:hypothetical protein